MSQILESLRNVNPNDSDAVKEIITTFFQKLPKHTEVNCNVWLCVLESVITRFPRYCAQHRPTIENYIVHFLDSSNYYNVIEAAKCAHGLQQIRPSQDKAATAKNCWREQMSILCTTAHKLIEAIFSKTVDIYKGNKNIKKLDTSLLSNTPLTTALSHSLNMKKGQNYLDKNMVLCNKLRNIFVFIQAMLVEVYPVGKPIQPHLILEVIVQALSVSSSINTNASEAAMIKIQALRTVDALISCLGPNLIPFSALVFRCVMQTLRWSSDNPSEESSKVRCGAYGSLSRWWSALHVHAARDELAEHVLRDVTPRGTSVLLTASNQYTKNLSKKARKKLANTMLQQSSIASHMPGEKNKLTESEETNDEVAIAALECAEMFLTASGIFLKPATHKMLQERLVRECYKLPNYPTSRAIPLLRALDACRKNTPYNVPPPTQYLLHLYSTLINSQNEEIKRFSSQALLEIRLQLHCSPPSLNFALEAQPDKRRTEEKRKRISEKNRAALESLLGKERMPPSDEVITIPDEPSNKRARLESKVITDNISVSSDSDKSIEISDDEGDDDIVLEIPQEESPEQTQGEEVQENVEEIIETEEADYVINITDTVDSATELVTEEPNKSEQSNIHEAKTQIPSIIEIEGADRDNSNASMEVVYDLSEGNKVKVLDKLDDINLPSSNDTDDVQITCGQNIPTSQDLEPDSTEKNDLLEDSPKINGSNETAVENGANNDVIENIEVKITTKEMSLDDMLADFVDEVNEEGKTEA